jgi:predicted Zn-ribbon and HTH transcriptional regulator
MLISVEIHEAHCVRCGYIWRPIVLEPRSCPKCRSYKWQTPKPPQKEKPRVLDQAG